MGMPGVGVLSRLGAEMKGGREESKRDFRAVILRLTKKNVMELNHFIC